MNTLYLQNHSARRVGLSRTKAPSGGCQPKGNQPENQPKENQPKGKYDSPTPPVSPPPVPFKMHTMEEPKPNKVEDDVTAQPAPDSSDDEAYEKRQNIQPSQNIGKKEKAEKKNGLRGGKAKGPTINGKIKPEKHLKETIPSQEDSPHSPKRKSQDELEGGAFAKKKRVKTQAKYSSQSSQGKSIGKHAKNAKSSSIKGNASRPPAGGFKSVEALSDPESPQKTRTKKLKQVSPMSSPQATPEKAKKIKISKPLSPSPIKKQPGFIVQDFDDFDELSAVTPAESILSKREKKDQVPSNEPLSQLPSFKMPDGVDDLANQARAFVDEDDVHVSPSWSPIPHADEESESQQNRCPMCKKLVDEDYIQKFKNLSSFAQHKACQSHQKSSASEEWKLKGFPEIDWEALNSRIDEHRQFITDLIEGADCHSRALLKEKVRTGKERSLRTTHSNLTPGYYGGRGLRAISEHVMGVFSTLLKKRAIKDKIIAARGVTGFVQSVVVPEVTVLLISEDMSVGVEEAREILQKSVGLGEMVHEEIKDVVKRRVQDSDDDEDLDD